MDVLLTYDYELFFGPSPGTPEKCMIEPTRAISEILDRHGARATFYADVGYLAQCRAQGRDLANHDRVVEQLRALSTAGHEIGLHIHPHWEDSTFRDGAWRLDTRRYRLQDFPAERCAEIVARYGEVFRDVVGEVPFSYRAGGWCLQPFEVMSAPLFAAGVRVDSTVFPGGYNRSTKRGYDFRAAPARSWWHFDDDPLRPVSGGRFTEIPITALRVSPSFYWRLAARRLLGRRSERSIGDGSSIPLSRVQLSMLLTRSSTMCAALDGSKSELLSRAYRLVSSAAGASAGPLVAIGHPKAQTRGSLRTLDAFLRAHLDDRFLTTARWWTDRVGG